MSNATTVTISAVTGSTEYLVLENLNFDESRDAAALRIGRAVVDSIYNVNEGGK